MATKRVLVADIRGRDLRRPVQDLLHAVAEQENCQPAIDFKSAMKGNEMTKSVTLSLLIALALAAGSAVAGEKMSDMKDMDMGKKSDAAKPATHSAVGVVKKIDLKTGTVNLDHEPVPSLKWPAMNMNFKVENPDLLKDVAVGQKVTVTFVKKSSGYVITQLDK